MGVARSAPMRSGKEGTLVARIGAIIPAIAEELAGERDRWAPWLPVGLGAGIALYFALPGEPPPWLAIRFSQ